MKRLLIKLWKSIDLFFSYNFNKKVYSHHLLLHTQLQESRAVDMKRTLNEQIDKYLLKKNKEDKFILVEVGSFLGESLELWGDLLEQRIKDNFLIINVDPYNNYVSNEDLIKDPNKSRSVMKMSKKIEKVYMYFIHNISLKKWRDKHICLRMNSKDAFYFFKKIKLKIDFCYIDGSHYYEKFKFDLENYYNLLSSLNEYKGIICGDDLELDYNDLLKKFDKNELDNILIKNKTTDTLIYNNQSLGNFLFHPGITLAISETKIKIKKFSSGFFIGF